MNLAPRHHQAIITLLTGTVADAARASGVTERTVYNWLTDPDFAAALAEAESAAVAAVARVMAGGAEKAARALLDVLDDPEATRRERIAAARAYLSSLPPIRLLGSIEERIDALNLNLNLES